MTLATINAFASDATTIVVVAIVVGTFGLLVADFVAMLLDAFRAPRR